VRLTLSEIFVSLIQPSFEELNESLKVDKPYDGDKKSIEKEHYAFLFYHTELLLVDVVQGEVLHKKSHYSCCEE
jgi:hypothetical protein